MGKVQVRSVAMYQMAQKLEPKKYTGISGNKLAQLQLSSQFVKDI
jgi:hypothetical protein